MTVKVYHMIKPSWNRVSLGVQIQNIFTVALDCGETQAVGPQYYNGVKCTLKMIFMLIHLRFFSKFFGASLIGMLVQKNQKYKSRQNADA